jgi:hypothetical protein
MMFNIFEIIIDYLKKNQNLKDSINSFHFLDLSNDVSYPAILIKEKFKNYNLNVYEKISNIEIAIDLILMDDSYDEIQFLNLYHEIINLLKSFVLIDEKIQIVGYSKYTSQIKKDNIFLGNFEISMRIFFKNCEKI